MSRRSDRSRCRLARASAVVVTYLDVPGAMKVLANARAHAAHEPVIVRTQDDHDLEKLQAAGATEVVPEAIEGSLMLASHALALVGVPMRRVIRVVQDQRDARYNLRRGYFHAHQSFPARRRSRHSQASWHAGRRGLAGVCRDPRPQRPVLMQPIRTEADIEAAVACLIAIAPAFEAVMARAGTVPLRYRPPGYAGLASIVVAQMVSRASADAIWTRLEALTGGVTADTILAHSIDDLRAAGLSGAKQAALRGLAEACRDGLVLEETALLPADAAIAALTAVK
eukprot:gene12819-17080_t